MIIRHTASVLEARAALAEGFCPVECSFGEESVVDALMMDHHGVYAHLESVALRAWRDHWGARRADARFVVTGAADADATFAIAALAGLLPEGRELGTLAELISDADTRPLSLAGDARPEAAILLLWRRMSSGAQDATAFYGGVDRWRALLRATPPLALLEAARAEEAARIAAARQAQIQRFGENVALVESAAPGFDVWYAESAPVIVAYVAEGQRVIVGVKDLATAQRLFGPRGLLEVFPKLEPPGWGGRETVGGSPRGAVLDYQAARIAARRLATNTNSRPEHPT